MDGWVAMGGVLGTHRPGWSAVGRRSLAHTAALPPIPPPRQGPGPGGRDLGGWRPCALMLVIRFLLLPLLGAVVVLGSHALGWWTPLDPVFSFVLLLQWAVPTANQMQVRKGAAGGRGQQRRGLRARLWLRPHYRQLCTSPPPFPAPLLPAEPGIYARQRRGGGGHPDFLAVGVRPGGRPGMDDVLPVGHGLGGHHVMKGHPPAP